MGSQAPEVWQLYEGFGFVLALFCGVVFGFF